MPLSRSVFPSTEIWSGRVTPASSPAAAGPPSATRAAATSAAATKSIDLAARETPRASLIGPLPPDPQWEAKTIPAPPSRCRHPGRPRGPEMIPDGVSWCAPDIGSQDREGRAMNETTGASRSLLSVTPCLIAVLGCLLAAACARAPQPGDPLQGLRRAQRDRFEKGRLVFERRFTPETGLGPLFNAVSCGECHEAPKSGGSGDEVELHATAFLVRAGGAAAARAGGAASRRAEAAGPPPEGTCDPLTDQGGPVVQEHVTPALKKALGIDEEPVPSRATGK